MNKSILHWLVTVLIGIVLGAYGWIFSSVIDRVAKTEADIKGLNIPLLQIQTDLAGIKSDISWIREAQQKSK
jgi:peptidoglycan hydrolase CwlO-like protein